MHFAKQFNLKKAYFKNQVDPNEDQAQVEPVILAELYAELHNEMKEKENEMKEVEEAEQQPSPSKGASKPMRKYSSSRGPGVGGIGDTDYETMNLSNFDSDIGGLKWGFPAKDSRRLFAGGGTTTGDEGGHITM